MKEELKKRENESKEHYINRIYSSKVENNLTNKEVIDNALGQNQEEVKIIINELKKYASSCNDYLRANHISAKDRAGFISAIVLALTNKESVLYTLTEASMPDENSKKVFKDKIGKKAVDELMQSLEDIWVNQDKIPDIKIISLREYYNRILGKNLLEHPEGAIKYFKYGDNILSSCIFSVYTNIVKKLEKYTEVDIMGTFYTVFLKYAKGDTKDKGIVLTPKHIMELFCDIAEYYLGKKLDDTTKILDTCCGTGGFLIGALHRMDTNIKNKSIAQDKKDEKHKKVRLECLIGVEREPEMFALAYTNMRFHGDGKSNLYLCSSLLKDCGVARKDSTGKAITLKEEFEQMEDKIKVGMINPPYALLNTKDKKKKGEKQTGQSELDFIFSMLSYLDIGGIGIAIVPMSCASNKNEAKLRNTILKEHTLLACMTMPPQVFKNSDVTTNTCIVVFKAHIPHKDSTKNVFVARWIDDGFVTIPHSGRFDKENKWLAIKQEWIRQIKGQSSRNDSVYMNVEINENDEWLAEAYVPTDYSKLTKDNFVSLLKRYALYKYMQENDLLTYKNEQLVDIILDFVSKYQSKKTNISDESIDLILDNFKEFSVMDLFHIDTGKDLVYSNLTGDDYNVVGQGKDLNGVVKTTSILEGYELYNAETTLSLAHIGNFFATIQSSDFYAGTRVKSLIANFQEFGSEYERYKNKYILSFIATIINYEEFRFCYGRVGSDKIPDLKIKLPCIKNKKGEYIKKVINVETDKKIKNKKVIIEKEVYVPDFEYMESFIKSLQFSKFISEEEFELLNKEIISV